MSRFVYPRLPRAIAKELLQDVEQCHGETRDSLEGRVAFRHPRAAPYPAGTVAGPSKIQDVRQQVLKALEPWITEGLPESSKSDFDRALGRSLHNNLDIVCADAAHEGPWSFLSLVVFPDVVACRFPELHDSRVLGTTRNALRRVWQRQEVLGELLHSGDPPLGEDELVGMFERSSMVRNRLLAVALAECVLAYDGANARSEFARKLYMLVRRTTGPLMLDVMERTRLHRHVASLVGRADELATDDRAD